MNRIFFKSLTRSSNIQPLLKRCALFEKISNRPTIHASLSTLVDKPSTKVLNKEDDDVVFGVGGRYVELDSEASKAPKSIKSRINSKTSSFESQKQVKKIVTTAKAVEVKRDIAQPIDESNQFGTLTNSLDTIISYSRATEALSDDKSQNASEEATEKKYDKVLQHVRLSNAGDRKNSEQFYVDKIEALVNQNKTREALNVFFLEMIEQDRFKPTLYLYKVMIRHLARVGYTHMAFSLFKKLTNSQDDDWHAPRNRTKLEQIVTLLFAACANSPWPEYAIRKTDSIRFYLRNRGLAPNLHNYQAMISAYGRAGAVYEAFNVVDEMLENKVKPDVDVFGNLLCACISQPDYGFKYALLTWQMCLKFKIKPDVTMFNLLLHAATNCHLGPSPKKQPKQQQRLPDTNSPQPGLTPPSNTTNNSSIIQPNRSTQNLFPKNTADYIEFGKDEDYVSLKREPANKNETHVDDNDVDPSQKVSELSDHISQRLDNDADDNDNVLHVVKSEETEILDEDKIMAKALGEQISQLEWWQDVKAHVDPAEILRSVDYIKNPEMRAMMMEQAKVNDEPAVLTKKCDEAAIEEAARHVVEANEDTALRRLELVGGVEGVFRALAKFKRAPDFKLFNILVQIVPENAASEEDLMARMRASGVKPNVDFVNFLIRRRLRRKCHEEADKAFKMLQEHNISPNVRTFHALTFKILNKKLLEEFLQDLKAMRFVMTDKMLSSLYKNGINTKRAEFLQCLFAFVIENKVPVGHAFVQKIQNEVKNCKNAVILMEKRNPDAFEESEKNKYDKLRRFYMEFEELVKHFVKNAAIAQNTHPYARFGNSENRLFQSHLKQSEKFQKTVTQ